MSLVLAALWNRLDRPGHEAIRWIERPSGWLLTGNAVFANEGEPCQLEYTVACDCGWQTQSATVEGWAGRTPITVQVEVDAGRRWWLNGLECPDVAGCLDIDLSFSPSTNTLPLRRLDLRTGQAAPVRAAWLRFPAPALEPLDQLYRRVDATTYHYESAGGAFTAELGVSPTGLVTRYPGLWQLECEA
jgi:hypothetical protein